MSVARDHGFENAVGANAVVSGIGRFCGTNEISVSDEAEIETFAKEGAVGGGGHSR